MFLLYNNSMFKDSTFFLLVLAGVAIRLFTLFLVYPISQYSSPTLIFFIFNLNFHLPFWVSLSGGIMNPIVLYLILSREKVEFKNLVIFALVFNPWSIFLELKGSMYPIYLLMLFIIYYLSYHRTRSFINSAVLFLLIIISALLSVWNLIIIVGLAGIILPGKYKLLRSKLSSVPDVRRGKFVHCFTRLRSKTTRYLRSLNKSIIAMVGLVIIIYLLFFRLNPPGFRTYFIHEVSFLSNIGIYNSANDLQKELMDNNLLWLGRWVENKYIFLLSTLGVNNLTAFYPSTYIIADDQIYSSIVPVLFVSFIIPFYIGLIQLINKKDKLLLLFPFCLVPAVVSRNLVDVERLLLFSPLVYFCVGKGFSLCLKKVPKTWLFFVNVLFFSSLFGQFVMVYTLIYIHEFIH